MLVILHVDDNNDWLNNVQTNIKKVSIGGREQVVEIISRRSVDEARDVINGAHSRMRELLTQGHRLNAVILDLMIGGGTLKEAKNWLRGMGALAEKMPDEDFSGIDVHCPAFALGRLAKAKGAKVIILTNIGRFLKDEVLPIERERLLIQAAAGASGYVVKSQDGSCYREIQEVLAR
jgi:hypothetical protein